jgi:hypothetical protein
MNADAVHDFNRSARPDIPEISDDEHHYRNQLGVIFSQMLGQPDGRNACSTEATDRAQVDLDNALILLPDACMPLDSLRGRLLRPNP